MASVRLSAPGHWPAGAAAACPTTASNWPSGTPAATTIELNLRLRNSSLTEFAFTPKRHMLLTYNTLPHLDDAEYASWITYA